MIRGKLGKIKMQNFAGADTLQSKYSARGAGHSIVILDWVRIFNIDSIEKLDLLSERASKN